MRPEILQALSQIAIFIGTLLTALGGYGHYHYGKKIEQKREIVIDSQLDSIPRSINATNSQNTDKVLVAIRDVKQTVDEIASSDGSNIKEISYPSSGKFGINVLDKNTYKYTIGTYSMKALIPKNQELTVKISGTKWGFPAFQSLSGWKHFDYESTLDNKSSRKFKTLKFGSVDLEFYLTGTDEIEIFIYENDSKTPSWEKKIIVEDKNS